MRPEDQEAKAHFIEGYFEDLRRRVELLPRLNSSGYPDESLLLCCCRIESLGSSLYWRPEEESAAKNFVRILREYGGEEVLWHIHPQHLIKSLQERVPKLYRLVGDRLRATLASDEHVLRSPSELAALLDRVLTRNELEQLNQQLWRGTIASLVYLHLRSPLVHGPGAVPLLLSKATLHGAPVPALDFELLFPPLCRILSEAKRISVTSNSFYGHDFRSSEPAGI
jgi:hypothetical protein